MSSTHDRNPSLKLWQANVNVRKEHLRETGYLTGRSNKNTGCHGYSKIIQMICINNNNNTQTFDNKQSAKETFEQIGVDKNKDFFPIQADKCVLGN